MQYFKKLILIILFCHLAACPKRDIPVPHPTLPPSPKPNEALNLTNGLSADMPEAKLSPALDTIIKEISKARINEMSSIYKSIENLAKQPAIVNVITSKYRNLAKKKYLRRKLIVQIAGQLKRSDMLGFLEEVTWKPLPQKILTHGLSEREFEEMKGDVVPIFPLTA